MSSTIFPESDLAIVVIGRNDTVMSVEHVDLDDSSVGERSDGDATGLAFFEQEPDDLVVIEQSIARKDSDIISSAFVLGVGVEQQLFVGDVVAGVCVGEESDDLGHLNQSIVGKNSEFDRGCE